MEPPQFGQGKGSIVAQPQNRGSLAYWMVRDTGTVWVVEPPDQTG
jgi:hypothetical protein